LYATATLVFGCATLGQLLAQDRLAESNPTAVVRIGAVAYAPSTVTVFQGLCRYLNRSGLTSDYVLYSNYDALVAALDRGDVDIAWNTPLAHAQFHVKQHGSSQTLVMRDVD
jgi:ABC-type phosphate/phosphonate transport system substrate-binding protein